jgi:GH35 family endo-1,4-beta-xylanase
MKVNLQRTILNVLFACIFLHSPLMALAQHAAWYQSAQQRIDTLRKSEYSIRILDKHGEPYTGNVAVRMERHEFPFGIAFDFQQGEPTMGTIVNTPPAAEAPADAEIYLTERRGNILSYAIPVESGNEYDITLKFAESIRTTDKARVFNVWVDGELFLKDFDIHAVAGGMNIAVDTSATVVALTNVIRLEMQASTDLVAIRGIVIEEIKGVGMTRINCGGPGLTTSDGFTYVAENGYFAPDVSTSASNDDWRKATMFKYFNAGVNENSFKWSGIQPQQSTLNYTSFDNAVRWTQKVGWNYRAHTLVWGGNDHHSTPDWVRNLPSTQAIYDAHETRIIREVTRYRGIIKEYDVVNEPLTGHADWLRKTHGDSILWKSFKWARSADPDAELYVNDYNVEYNWGQAREYRDLIRRMLENGAPVTGVGMQAHFWDCCRPNVNELVNNINIIAEAGLPIKLTEYDYGGNLTQAQQAADYIMVLTIAFSHPSIVGMYHWSLRDGWAWRTNAGLFDSTGKPKLAADTLLYFTKTKWATNFDAQIGNDPLVFKAYHGNYTIEAEFDGVVKEFSVPFLKAHADSIFVLNELDARVKGPQLLSAELKGLNAINLLFDKPINENMLRRNDFRFFSSGFFNIAAVGLNPENENSVILTFNRDVVPGRYISLSYFPGSLVAADGGVAKAFGPIEIKNVVLNTDVFNVERSTVNVYPNPASNQVSIASDHAPFTIHIYNSNGVLLYSEKSNSESISVDVSKFSRGMYIIRITDVNNGINVEKLILN